MAYPPQQPRRANNQNNYYDPSRSGSVENSREYRDGGYGAQGAQYQQQGQGYNDGYNQNYNQGGQRPPPQRQHQQQQGPSRQGNDYPPPQGRQQRGPPGPPNGQVRDPRAGPQSRGGHNGQQHRGNGGYQQDQSRSYGGQPPQNGYGQAYQGQDQYQEQYGYDQQYDDGYGYQQDNYQQSQQSQQPRQPRQPQGGHRGREDFQQGNNQDGYDQGLMYSQGGGQKPPPTNNQPRPQQGGIVDHQQHSPQKTSWDNPFPSFGSQDQQRPSTADGRYKEHSSGSQRYNQGQQMRSAHANHSESNLAYGQQNGYNDHRTMSPPQPGFAAPQRSNTMPTDIAQNMSNMSIQPNAAMASEASQHLNFSQPRRPSLPHQGGSNSRHQSQSTQSNGQADGYDDFLDSYAEEPEPDHGHGMPHTSPGTDEVPNFGAAPNYAVDKTLHMARGMPSVDAGRGRQQGRNPDFQQQEQRSRSQGATRNHPGQAGPYDDYNNAQNVPAIDQQFLENSQAFPPRNASAQGHRKSPSQQYARDQHQNQGNTEFGLPARAQTDAFGPGQVTSRVPADPYVRTASRGPGLPTGPSPRAALNATPISQAAMPVNGQRMSSESVNRPRPAMTSPNGGIVVGSDPSRMSDTGSLSGHPAPIRPGLMPQSQTPIGQGTRPPPVRNYNGSPANGFMPQQMPMQQQAQPQYQDPEQRRPSQTAYGQSQSQQPVASAPQQQRPPSTTPVITGPVTYEELQRTRAQVQQNPSDQALQLHLAKRMLEAATVLADEGGRADSKTKSKNRDRYTMEACQLVKKLVAANYTDAMFYMAENYGSGGLGLRKDPGQAFTLYQSAAKLNHAPAAYRVAVCCELGGDEGGGTKRDPLKAVQWYQRAAMLGDVPAMYKIGVIKLKGLLGQPQNPREAVTWLKRAAEQADAENPHALHELGLLYRSAGPNDNIIRDEGYAAQLFCQAADLGYKFSQFSIAEAYEFGYMGFPIDPRQSITWYSKAAQQEEHKSELALSGWYLTGAEGIMASNDTEAYLWARKAANSGLAKAEYAMGYFTEVGIGCVADPEGAKRWYWKAASQGYEKARERLESLRRGGPKAQKTRVSRSAVNRDQGDCKVM